VARAENPPRSAMHCGTEHRARLDFSHAFSRTAEAYKSTWTPVILRTKAHALVPGPAPADTLPATCLHAALLKLCKPRGAQRGARSILRWWRRAWAGRVTPPTCFLPRTAPLTPRAPAAGFGWPRSQRLAWSTRRARRLVK